MPHDMFGFLDNAGHLHYLKWIFCGLATILAIYGFHPVQRWKYRHIPGPSPWWLVGNIPTFIAKGQPQAFLEWEKTYGPYFKFFLGGSVNVVVGDPAECRKVARKSAVRAGIRFLEIGAEKQFNEYSIVTSRGDLWRATSNAWHPFFTRESLAAYANLMEESADKFVKHLGDMAEAASHVDIHRQLGTLSLDVVGRSAFGVDFHNLASLTAIQPESAATPAAVPQEGNDFGRGGELHQKGKHKDKENGLMVERIVADAAEETLLEAVKDIFASFGSANIWLVLQLLFPELDTLIRYSANLFPSPNYRKNLQSRKTLKKVSANLLAIHRKQNANHERDGKSNDTTGKKRIAVHANVQIIQQSHSFLLGGYETTANALTFSVFCLSANPDKEAKLLAEIDSFGDRKEINVKDLQDFPYAAAVWKEALRLYPPLTVINREASVNLNVGGYFIPKDTILQGNLYAMHRSPEHWKDPEAFTPERFLEGEPEALESNLNAYLPFGEGARKCPGYGFATQEGLITLVRIYQKYVFRLAPGQLPLKTAAMLTHGPVNGVHVTIHRRN